jgi:hypothetical protein
MTAFFPLRHSLRWGRVRVGVKKGSFPLPFLPSLQGRGNATFYEIINFQIFTNLGQIIASGFTPLP